MSKKMIIKYNKTISPFYICLSLFYLIYFIVVLPLNALSGTETASNGLSQPQLQSSSSLERAQGAGPLSGPGVMGESSLNSKNPRAKILIYSRTLERSILRWENEDASKFSLAECWMGALEKITHDSLPGELGSCKIITSFALEGSEKIKWLPMDQKTSERFALNYLRIMSAYNRDLGTAKVKEVALQAITDPAVAAGLGLGLYPAMLALAKKSPRLWLWTQIVFTGMAIAELGVVSYYKWNPSYFPGYILGGEQIHLESDMERINKSYMDLDRMEASNHRNLLITGGDVRPYLARAHEVFKKSILQAFDQTFEEENHNSQ